ncbi:unnamed protein product [Rotaria sp. Silwood2]|nr:unnamed protein product [Rotaria sp. Silwood2]
MFSGPAFLRRILAHPDRHKYVLSSLQYVGVGSTPVHSDFLRMLEAELRIGRIGQEYGLTESGTFLSSTLYVDYDDDRRHTSIGRCVPHIELKIASNDGTTLPIGSEGEIWARGYSVMRGYYNDPEQTANAITNNGWLRTGDLASMDEEGYLFFVGRKKEMVIQAGVNIYPLEIERAIYEHPSVAEVYVFGIPDPLIDEVSDTIKKRMYVEIPFIGQKKHAMKKKVIYLSNNLRSDLHGGDFFTKPPPSVYFFTIKIRLSNIRTLARRKAMHTTYA